MPGSDCPTAPATGLPALEDDLHLVPPPAAPVPDPQTLLARPGSGGHPRNAPRQPPEPSGDFGPADPLERQQTLEWQRPRAPEPGEEDDPGEASHVVGGRYRIMEGLAMGGMGAVFQVRHRSLGKTFALKIIHQGLSSNPQMQSFFSREAQVLSHLSHPNIVQITDFGEDERFGAYLVMEYLQGESLHARLQRESRLGLPTSLQVALQVAEALSYMHGLDLIHCDIKPENIFLCRQPEDGRSRIVTKIIDFGLSRSMAKGARLNAAEVGGTPHFAAPEQLAGLAPQPSMDIYAVGELLYMMITGVLPFTGSYTEVYSRKSTEAPPSPSAVMGEPLDAQLESLILKALEVKPEHRHTSMAQIVFELRTVMDMLGMSPKRRTRQLEVIRTTPAVGTPTFDPGVLCDACSLPVFLLGSDGRIRSASPTFARLVHESPGALVGKRLEETQIGGIYPDAAVDLKDCLERRSALQRRLRVNLEGGQTLTYYVWLLPQPGTADGSVQHWGIVMPLSSEAE